MITSEVKDGRVTEKLRCGGRSREEWYWKRYGPLHSWVGFVWRTCRRPCKTSAGLMTTNYYKWCTNTDSKDTHTPSAWNAMNVVSACSGSMPNLWLNVCLNSCFKLNKTNCHIKDQCDMHTPQRQRSGILLVTQVMLFYSKLKIKYIEIAINSSCLQCNHGCTDWRKNILKKTSKCEDS